MFELIKNFDNLNFNNIMIDKSEYHFDKNKLTFKIIIDDRIEVHYPHYYFKKDENTPIIKGFDVFYNKIWEYVVNKYETRLSRMKEEPIFIILGEYELDIPSIFDYSLEKERKILELNTNYKIVLITKFKELLKYNDNKHLIILDETTRGKIINEINPNPEYFYEKHHKEILEFIEK